MTLLLDHSSLPAGFDYPREFLRIVALGITDHEPWVVLQGNDLSERHRGLKHRYPGRTLMPFARRIDNDDVACWDLDRGGDVVVVHDFASPGWEQVAHLGGVYDWLRSAIEDFIQFE